MTNDVKIGKQLSYILRHHPESAGITLDSDGYADTAEIISALSKNFDGFNFRSLERIVVENDKQRYSFNKDKTKIRANQGHSLKNVNINFKTCEPPAVLYHGTGLRFMDSIRKEGIKKMSRQYVHLSPDEDTAVKVGKRHGKPFVIKIDAAAMFHVGYIFYLSENGVWLTDYVPVKYFMN